jgi:ribosomal-protein-alanine N-acetyltransferase
MRFITGVPSSKAQALAALSKYLHRWQTHDFGLWAVRFKDDPTLLGWCGLDFLDTTAEIEVGYGLARSHWGRGVSTEAARASLEFGFEHLDLDRIVAVARPENTASRHVMEKLGMKYVRNGFYYGRDLVYYEIGRDDFSLSASSRVLRDNS